MITLPVYLDFPVTQLRRYSVTSVSPAELRALLIEDNIPGITEDTPSGHVYAAVSAILASNAQVLLRELDRQATEPEPTLHQKRLQAAREGRPEVQDGPYAYFCDDL